MSGLFLQADDTVRLPVWLLVPGALSDRALRLYVRLAHWAGHAQNLPPVSVMQGWLDIDETAVNEAVVELIAVGAIEAAETAYIVRRSPRRAEDSEPFAVHERDALVGEVLELRRAYGGSERQWTPDVVRRATELALTSGESLGRIRQALRRLACDAADVSPLALCRSGPWWSLPAMPPFDAGELDEVLDSLDGRRVGLQQQARDYLSQQGLPVTRTATLAVAVSLAYEQGLITFDGERPVATEEA